MNCPTFVRRLAGLASIFCLAHLLLSSPACLAAPAALEPALESLRAEALLGHIQRLSSDAFEGRSPGTRGEELTVEYLVSQFQQIGLQPGYPEGGFVQNVPRMG